MKKKIKIFLNWLFCFVWIVIKIDLCDIKNERKKLEYFEIDFS
jgi:hypothetical protein